VIGIRHDQKPGQSEDDWRSSMPEGGYGRSLDRRPFVRPPSWFMACSIEKHAVVDNEDGTMTAAPSILLKCGDGRPDWHGYLEKGVWRSC
jgi:hypothetical protein